MKRIRFTINELRTVGLTLIILIIVLLVLMVINVVTNDSLKPPNSLTQPFIQFTLTIVVGWIKIFVSQVMAGLGLIGGGQIIYLMLKRKGIWC